jgi:hypothetical protein
MNCVLNQALKSGFVLTNGMCMAGIPRSTLELFRE